MLEPAGFFVWVTAGGVRVLGAIGDQTRLDETQLSAAENFVAPQPARAAAGDRRFANPAIYRAAARVRLPREDGLLSLEPSPPLDLVLARAAAGATEDALARALVDDEVSFEEALELVRGLVERELLLADAAPQQKSPERRWARGEAVLARAAVEELARALDGVRSDVDPFVRAFVTRFGDDEVPLLFALDPEAGVPFAGGRIGSTDLLVARCRVEGGRLIHLGEGALSLISDEEPLAAPLRRLCAAEETLHPGARFAELRCPGDSPPARLRELEIACLVPPDAPPASRLPLSDLRLAVDGERLLLRSARLACEVIPRRAAEAPPASASHVAAFLCALQQISPVIAAAGAYVDIPFLRATPHPPARAPHRPIRRFFTPGSEWCELQLFGAPTVLDALVIALLAPFATRARDAGWIDGWFFLRGEAHLAAALHGPPQLRGELLSRFEDFAAPLLADGRLHEYVLVPYRRQVARFGGADGIVIAERIFEADSEAVAALLDALDLDDARARADLALLGIDALFDDLGLPLEAKRAAIAPHAPSLLGDEIDDGPLFAAGDDHPLAPGIAILRTRSSRLAPLVAELRARQADHRLSRALAEMAPSYAHHFANRLLGSLEKEQSLYPRLRRIYWKEESPR